MNADSEPRSGDRTLDVVPPDLPERLARVPSLAGADDGPAWSWPPREGARQSAVLMLFSDGHGAGGADVLLTERSRGLRSHAGQVSFPGGGVDPGDAGPAGAALREAHEETGIDPAGIAVLGQLPPLFLPPSGYVVTPVLAWWQASSDVGPLDAREVASVVRAPLAELAEPANQTRVRHPSGYVGPAFRVQGLYVWGFTAGLLERVLRLAGLQLLGPRAPLEDLPADVIELLTRPGTPA